MTINQLEDMKYIAGRISFRNMRLILPLLIVLISIFTLYSQPTDGLVAYYSFDACDATEDTGSGADGIIMGNANCGCGVLGNGFEFDGNTMIQILGNPEILFTKDFTISFFIKPDPQSNSVMDILSKSETCGIDSTVELRYNPVTRDLRLSLSQHADLSIKTGYNLPTTACYHHIVFVRRNRELILFYDGVQKALSPSVAFVDIQNDGILTLGGGPCLSNGEVAFRGVLDELRMYNRALTFFEVQQLNSPIDEITTPDTVLFTGTSMQVRLPVTCAANVLWSPATGVNDVNVTQPILSPPATTTYNVELDYGFCRASDTIHLTVADSSDLDCDKVFFPTGFTPNGDNINDVWGMSNVVFLGDFVTLTVYDRWGGELFTTDDQNELWDGTFKGNEVMPGLYVYQFTYNCNGEEKRKTGSIAVIK